jgi:carboxymethylenebutenolidase
MKRAESAVALLVLAAGWSSAQPHVRERLEKSPRHQEWVRVQHDHRVVHAYLVYPERKEKTPVIVIIHENRGLTDWVRSVADQVAEAGYIALAPDLLSGMAPGGGKTSDFPSEDAAREGISKLPPDQVTADLDAVADYAKKIPAANGKIAVAGFCWGGMQAFRFATHRADLAAAYVFYGTGPDSAEAVARIRAPVFGFYGGNDARVNATIPKSEELMKAAGKVYEPVIYEGAGHGFMRMGEEPDASAENRKAREQAWARWKQLLARL